MRWRLPVRPDRGRHWARRWPPRVVEMVDAPTGTTHLLTPDAAAAGRRAEGRYVAVCGAVVLPAGMTDPGRGYCRSCTSSPGQRRSR
ncbi:MAG: hypothetical protein ACRDSF_00675 [Pseudonocardiaceae bacterium]